MGTDGNRKFILPCFQVGHYSDNIEEIVPVKELDLEEDIVDLFRSIFKKDHKERPAAMALVEMPLFLVGRWWSNVVYSSCSLNPFVRVSM